MLTFFFLLRDLSQCDRPTYLAPRWRTCCVRRSGRTTTTGDSPLLALSLFGHSRFFSLPISVLCLLNEEGVEMQYKGMRFLPHLYIDSNQPPLGMDSYGSLVPIGEA
jgi:hypothetical protein